MRLDLPLVRRHLQRGPPELLGVQGHAARDQQLHGGHVAAARRVVQRRAGHDAP